MHKCKNCPYVTTRLFDLHRHERRKTSCTPNLANTSTTNAVNVEQQNGTHAQQNGTHAQQNGTHAQQNGTHAQQNGDHTSQNGNTSIYCTKCKIQLSSKQSYDRHQSVCRGVASTVCTICFKNFSSRKSRAKHMRTVRCSSPTSTSSGQPSSSQQASIINNINIDNSQNVNIHLNFGEEALEKLCNQPDYLRRMEEIVRLGKYALPQHISDIYFNDSFPMNNTIMKTRHNDRFVKIKTGENEWNLRAMDDVYKTLTERMESYMTPLLRTRGEADGENLRRRPSQIQENDPKHPRVRPQGLVVGLEVRRHTTNRGRVERSVLRERAPSTYSGDEDAALGTCIRQNKGYALFAVN